MFLAARVLICFRCLKDFVIRASPMVLMSEQGFTQASTEILDLILMVRKGLLAAFKIVWNETQCLRPSRLPRRVSSAISTSPTCASSSPMENPDFLCRLLEDFQAEKEETSPPSLPLLPTIVDSQCLFEIGSPGAISRSVCSRTTLLSNNERHCHWKAGYVALVDARSSPLFQFS